MSDYLDLGLFPEAIALRYPTVSLEGVYATITYYWHNKEQVDAYLREWREYGERMRREQELNPSPAYQRLRAMIRERGLETYSSKSGVGINPPKFLLDEHLPPSIADELRRRETGIQVLVIGEPGAPRQGTLDPDILLWAEASGYLLITNNRRSMPIHLAAGHHIPGILATSSPLKIGPLVNVLLLVWGASLPDEYRDNITYLPQI